MASDPDAQPPTIGHLIHVGTLNLGRAFWALLAYAPALLGSLVCTTRAVRVVEAKQRGGTKEL